MSTVRAKFKVMKIESSQTRRQKDPKGTWSQENTFDAEFRTIILLPVSGGSEENRMFWDAPPSGEIRLGTVNPEAWQAFVLGGEYYVDFVAASSPATAPVCTGIS